MFDTEVPAGQSTRSTDPRSSSEWYLRVPEGFVYGPLAWSVVQQWLSEGRVDEQCEIRDSTSAWRSAATEFPELSEPIVEGDPPPVVEQIPAEVRPANFSWALAMAVLGWLTLFPLFPFAAWWLGRRELREIERGRRVLEGKPLAIAGIRVAQFQLVVTFAIVGTIVLSLAILSFAY